MWKNTEPIVPDSEELLTPEALMQKVYELKPKKSKWPRQFARLSAIAIAYFLLVVLVFYSQMAIRAPEVHEPPDVNTGK